LGQYEYHIFVCTDGKSCGRDGSADVHAELKKCVKHSAISRKVRVNKAGCMNQCGHGPMVVVYPQDVWYAGVTVKGARRIVEEHLIAGEPVEKFRYVAQPGDNKKD
jgi:(2Fe-2S) ferredoxin